MINERETDPPVLGGCVHNWQPLARPSLADEPEPFKCKKCGKLRLASYPDGVMRDATRGKWDQEELDARLAALNTLLVRLEAGEYSVGAGGRAGSRPHKELRSRITSTSA